MPMDDTTSTRGEWGGGSPELCSLSYFTSVPQSFTDPQHPEPGRGQSSSCLTREVPRQTASLKSTLQPKPLETSHSPRVSSVLSTREKTDRD